MAKVKTPKRGPCKVIAYIADDQLFFIDVPPGGDFRSTIRAAMADDEFDIDYTRVYLLEAAGELFKTEIKREDLK